MPEVNLTIDELTPVVPPRPCFFQCSWCQVEISAYRRPVPIEYHLSFLYLDRVALSGVLPVHLPYHILGNCIISRWVAGFFLVPFFVFPLAWRTFREPLQSLSLNLLTASFGCRVKTSCFSFVHFPPTLLAHVRLGACSGPQAYCRSSNDGIFPGYVTRHPGPALRLSSFCFFFTSFEFCLTHWVPPPLC